MAKIIKNVTNLIDMVSTGFGELTKNFISKWLEGFADCI